MFYITNKQWQCCYIVALSSAFSSLFYAFSLNASFYWTKRKTMHKKLRCFTYSSRLKCVKLNRNFILFFAINMNHFLFEHNSQLHLSPENKCNSLRTTYNISRFLEQFVCGYENMKTAYENTIIAETCRKQNFDYNNKKCYCFRFCIFPSFFQPK